MTTDDASSDTESGPRLANPSPTTGAHPGGPRHSRDPFPAVADAVDRYLAVDFSGHDMAHAWRVFRLTQRFATDLNADHEIVGCGALTHDIHRVVGEGAGCDPEDTRSDIGDLLRDANVDDAMVPAVQRCVAVHDDLAFRGEDPAPETTEAKILRDADNLDAMGAVGIARTFAFGGAHETPLWDPQGNEYSQLYHFEDKLLRLREELHTAPARQVAEERHAFLERFFERFLAEWHGEA